MPSLHHRQSSRNIWIAAAASAAIHALVFGLTPRQPPALAPGPMANAPLNVVILPPAAVPEERVAEAPREPVATPPPPRPTPRRPARAPETAPVPAPSIAAPTPIPTPLPIPPPPVDMMAAIEARRAQRRAYEAAAARGPAAPAAPSEDAASRNLATLSGREGVGGVFQILRIGTRSAEFAFNGWRPDARSQWREVIEVDAGLNGNVQMAIIRRMIALIRTHYEGDFNWESHRLGRVIVLSARPEDNEGLEDFLYREFFGVPLVNPRR